MVLWDFLGKKQSTRMLDIALDALCVCLQDTASYIRFWHKLTPSKDFVISGTRRNAVDFHCTVCISLCSLAQSLKVNTSQTYLG